MHQRFQRIIYAILLCCFHLSHADQTDIDYNSDQSIINANQSAPTNAANSLDPNTTFKDYNPNPPETNYYQGVDQTDSDIDDQGKANLDNDPAGGTVYDNFATRPTIDINPDSSDFDISKLAEYDSYNITHGISDQYVDCEHHTTCHTETEEHQCKKSNTVTLNCTQTATPELKTVTVPAEDVPFSGVTNWTSGYDYNRYISIPINTTGYLTSFHIDLTSTSTPWAYFFSSNHYWITISPITGRMDYYAQIGQMTITYDYKNLNIPVSAGDVISIAVNGREYALPPSTLSAPYSGVVVIPSYQKNEGYVQWSDTVCP